MKPHLFSPQTGLRAAAFALLSLVTLPATVEAKPKHGRHGHSDGDRHHSHNRDVYVRSPRSSFTLSFGTGYAGRGYYYGPPSAAYYYQTPGVVYYRTREAVPQRYWGSSTRYGSSGGYYRTGSSDAARCQSALYRRGYYRGPIDGDIGPGSREAIRRYQLRNGLTVTGYVDRGLMVSLGLW